MTKSKGLGRGGTRDGAGRPKIEKGKTATFATRVTQRTRDLLDAEAERQGNSVAAVAEQLLRLALEKKVIEQTRPKEVRQLFTLIEALLYYLPKQHHWNDPKYDWHSNPYLFEAFRLGIGYLLSTMRPSGEIVAPPAQPLPPKRAVGELEGNPYARFADELREDTQLKYPEAVDEYARHIARSVIGRAREQQSLEDARSSRRPITLSDRPNDNEDADWELRIDHLLADAARTLFDRGKK
jgi:hypothetical protein